MREKEAETMQFGLYCIECMLRRETENARRFGDMETGNRYIREVLQAIAQSPRGVSAPYMESVFAPMLDRYYHVGEDRFREIKRESNRWMLERLPGIRTRVLQADDPIRAALLYARCANYIDFSALGGRVNEQELDALLDAAPEAPLDETEYRHFREDLAAAKRFLLVADNAGEIVCDKLLCELLRAHDPALEVSVAVRGGPAMNDALREDAEQVGFAELGRIVDSGCRISGTELPYVGEAMRQALDEADVILAKGMGNFESMFGCGKNVYYLFLCKCERFVKMFGAKPMQGMLLHERRTHITPERQMA